MQENLFCGALQLYFFPGKKSRANVPPFYFFKFLCRIYELSQESTTFLVLPDALA